MVWVLFYIFLVHLTKKKTTLAILLIELVELHSQK